MSRKRLVAIQMDPIGGINPAGDSTLVLGLEAQARGYSLFYYTPDTLSYDEGSVVARGHFITLKDSLTDYYTLGEAHVLPLAETSAVLLRQDPPFDMSYITNTLLLERAAQDTLVVNDPASVRNCPEKWYANAFPEFVAPTLVSSDPEAIAVFRARHRDIVIKPLHGHGGHGVFHLKEQDGNFEAVVEHLLNMPRPVAIVAQKFIPAVKDGDLRVILADGAVAGVIRRIPAKGEIRSNLRVGGTAAAAELSPRQRMICEALEPELKSRGIVFAGIDLIGDYLTEINITSPTGLRSVRAVSGVQPEKAIWNAIEKRMG